jgi:hypothetical protein
MPPRPSTSETLAFAPFTAALTGVIFRGISNVENYSAGSGTLSADAQRVGAGNECIFRHCPQVGRSIWPTQLQAAQSASMENPAEPVRSELQAS